MKESMRTIESEKSQESQEYYEKQLKKEIPYIFPSLTYLNTKKYPQVRAPLLGLDITFAKSFVVKYIHISLSHLTFFKCLILLFVYVTLRKSYFWLDSDINALKIWPPSFSCPKIYQILQPYPYFSWYTISSEQFTDVCVAGQVE